jgi:hypothetical protein
MADKIEILENTITKLLFRRGTDSDRQAVTLSLGEPGFTTDTKRLFVGDGSTAGGIVAGNKYLGETAVPTLITTALTGDLCYATKNVTDQYFTTYIKTSNTNDLSSWTPVVPIASTPKAWVNFDGSSTIAAPSATIWSSHNVRYVDVDAKGEFTIYFTNTFASSAYAVAFGSSGVNSSLQIKTDNGADDGPTFTTKTTTSLKLRNTTASGSLTGTKNASVFIYAQ